jgi:hypothetical protein
MRFILGMCALIMTAIGSAQAAFYFAGGGSTSCALFLNFSKSNPTVAGLVYQSWLQGFFTGVNTVLGADRNQVFDLASIRGAEHSEFMSAYCARNPNANYKDGALELMGRLPRVPPP